MGDIDKETNVVNYESTTNNGDRDKILSTVVATAFSFFSKYPNYAIHVTGNTKSRTRLYQMAISNYFEELSIDFDIYGKLNGAYVRFKKGDNYEAFIIILKENI